MAVLGNRQGSGFPSFTVSLSLVDVEGRVPSSEDLSTPEGILPLPIGSLQIPVSLLFAYSSNLVATCLTLFSMQPQWSRNYGRWRGSSPQGILHFYWSRKQGLILK